LDKIDKQWKMRTVPNDRDGESLDIERQLQTQQSPSLLKNILVIQNTEDPKDIKGGDQLDEALNTALSDHNIEYKNQVGIQDVKPHQEDSFNDDQQLLSGTVISLGPSD